MSLVSPRFGFIGFDDCFDRSMNGKSRDKRGSTRLNEDRQLAASHSPLLAIRIGFGKGIGCGMALLTSDVCKMSCIAGILRTIGKDLSCLADRGLSRKKVDVTPAWPGPLQSLYSMSVCILHKYFAHIFAHACAMGVPDPLHHKVLEAHCAAVKTRC